MHGQRSSFQSLNETFEFGHESGSSSSGIDQHVYWNTILNPLEAQNLPDCLLTPRDDGGNMTSPNISEPSSSCDHSLPQASHDEEKMEHGWMVSSTAHTGAGPRLEERRFEPSNILSLETVNLTLNNNQQGNGPSFSQNPNSDDVPQTSEIHSGFVGNGGQAMEADIYPHPYKQGGSECEQIPFAIGSTDPSATASGTVEYLTEDSDGRPGCSLDNRHLSCKRKTLEGFCSPSLSGSSSFFQRSENSVWHAFPARRNSGSSSSISNSSQHLSNISPQEQSNSVLEIGARGIASDYHPASTVAGNAESSQRNFRMRVHPAHRQDSAMPNLWSPGNAIRHSHVWSPHQSSSRYLPNYHSLDLSRDTASMSSPQTHPLAPLIPGISQNVNPFIWNGAHNAVAGSSSNSTSISGVRLSALPEESNSRTITRSISEHPMFVPATEIRHFTQDTTNWSLADGNISIPGNLDSSQMGSSNGTHPSPALAWVPHQNPPTQYPLRLSEFVRRSLSAFDGTESRTHSSNYPPLRSGPTSSQEMVLSGSGNQGNRQSYMRSAFWVDRQGDGTLGLPSSLRTLATAPEGRSRFASEIRNVLELLQRGESLRFEDVLMLDQSVFYGADVHDRHRDMRLDVDNMSYEELLALEERIGNVNTGLSEETVLKCMKQQKYELISVGAPAKIEPCCICQEEYVEGEELGMLDCGHDFHTDCIKQWLMHKNLCPICKTTALVT